MVEDETLAAPNQNYFYKLHLPWKCRMQIKI